MLSSIMFKRAFYWCIVVKNNYDNSNIIINFKFKLSKNKIKVEYDFSIGHWLY